MRSREARRNSPGRTDDGTVNLAALTSALDAVRTRIRPDNTDVEIDRAITTTSQMLAMVAEPIAGFVNNLDDGNGASNSTADFGRLLARALDDTHRTSLTLALASELSPEAFALVEGVVNLKHRVASEPDV